jgi:hypothetical protein
VAKVDATGWFKVLELESVVLLRFFINSATGEPHIVGHNVSEDEVEDTWSGRSRTDQDLKVREWPWVRPRPDAT